jgi:hypothetical protein
MLSRKDVLLLAAGFGLAVATRAIWQTVCLPVPVWALDLAPVDANNRLWSAFTDFLGQEDEQLRVFAPQGGGKLAQYRGHADFFGRFLVAGEGVVRHDDLRNLTAPERIGRVTQLLERDYAGRNPEKTAALLTDLRQVLAERAAALELLRFSTPSYAQGLLDREVVVSWSVLWDGVGTRQRLKGTVDDLYRRRVTELLAASAGTD